VQLA